MSDQRVPGNEQTTVPTVTQHGDQTTVLKAAVTLAAFPDDQRVEFVTFYDEQSLSQTADELVGAWSLERDCFQLQFDRQRMPKPPFYITEENRHLIGRGDVLTLDYTPSKLTDVVLRRVRAGEVDDFLMSKLSHCCADRSLATIFIESSGIEVLKTYLENNFAEKHFDKRFELALQSIITLIEHNIVTWSSVDPGIATLLIKVLQENVASNRVQPSLIRMCLVVVENTVTSSPAGKQLVLEKKLSASSFFHNIKIQEQDIQSKCISLVNTVFSMVSKDDQRMLREFIYSDSIRGLMKERIFTLPIQEELAYQLYVLQTNMFHLLYERLMTPINPKDPEAIRTIDELWRKAFVDSTGDSALQPTLPGKGGTRDLSRLGFKNSRDPLCDFTEVPPGSMAFDCIKFFAQSNNAQYKQVVLENGRERADDMDCPFAQASVALTRMLATDILCINAEPRFNVQQNRTYYPLFFSKDKPFEELFSYCIVRFAKTWKEMRASSSDFDKVLTVVREQITRSLADSQKLHTFDSLKIKLNQCSFEKIQEIRQRELEEKEEQKSQSKPILQLKSMLEPSIREVIRQQRLNKMMSGHFFKSARARAREAMLFSRLSHNAKVLQYAMCPDTSAVPDELHSINILDITEVKESKRENRRQEMNMCISISVQGKEQPLDLYSSDPITHQLWLDGLSLLKGDQMRSQQADADMKELLSMEIKLRLLDAEGLSIPDEPPEVPPPPPHLNFVTA